MENLFERSAIRIKNTKTAFKRYLHKSIDWSNRLIAIKGARGVGKTTLLLQYIRENKKTLDNILYVSLDDIYFSGHNLIDVADYHVKNGGTHLFIDEVHKYATWSREIKTIYDTYINLKIVFTGSSILEIYKGDADLSRRAVSYELHGLSFREYLEMENKCASEVFSLKTILKNHRAICTEIIEKIQPIPLFKNYLKSGYFPYYKENLSSYHHRVGNSVNQVLESDLPSVYPFEWSSILKIKKLLSIIASSVPFTPNIQKLSEMIGSSRNTVLQFLKYLNDAHLINNLSEPAKGLKYLAKPEKIYLNNTNLIFALANENANIGNIRETFFYNQLNVASNVYASAMGDFNIDEKYTFEIGGKGKNFKQIKNIKFSFIAMDDIEVGTNAKIPLWLFGFLY